VSPSVVHTRRLRCFTLGLGVTALAIALVAPTASAANAKTKRVNIPSGGGQADDNAFRGSVSANGRYVAFVSQATDLVGSDTNGNQDVFVHDRKTKKTKRVSVRNGGVSRTV
jgi:hypothetical protein